MLGLRCWEILQRTGSSACLLCDAGSFSASTGWDVTIYVSTLPGDLLEFPLDPLVLKTVSHTSAQYIFFHNNSADYFPGAPANNFALIATSNIAVAAGSHQFCTKSNAGSWLYLDGSLLVKNEGLNTSISVCQDLVISQGFHNLTINYFSSSGGAILEVYMDGSLRVPHGIGATACTSCLPGTYTDSIGSSVCNGEPCSKGSFSKSGGTACTSCLPGTYTSSIGTSACSGEPCPAGSSAYSGATQSTDAKCRACPPGSFSNLSRPSGH